MTELNWLDNLLYHFGITTQNRQRYEEEQLLEKRREEIRKAQEAYQLQELQMRAEIRARLDDPRISKEDALNSVIRSGHRIGIEECIKAGADLNKPSPTLPLVEAFNYYANSNSTDGQQVIAMLLQNGADIKTTGVDGKLPIYYIQNLYAMDILIKYKGLKAVQEALNLKDKLGRTAGMLAVFAKRDPRIIMQIINAGLDLSVKDTQGNTLADYLIDHQRNHLSPNYAAVLEKVEQLEKQVQL